MFVSYLHCWLDIIERDPPPNNSSWIVLYKTVQWYAFHYHMCFLLFQVMQAVSLCQHCYISLGDLSRYSQQLTETPNWGKPRMWVGYVIVTLWLAHTPVSLSNTHQRMGEWCHTASWYMDLWSALLLLKHDNRTLWPSQTFAMCIAATVAYPNM